MAREVSRSSGGSPAAGRRPAAGRGGGGGEGPRFGFGSLGRLESHLGFFSQFSSGILTVKAWLNPFRILVVSEKNE